MKTSEILRRAADEIRRRGWYQGEFAPRETVNFDDCPVCAWGAINAVQNGDPREWYVKDGPAYESVALHVLAATVGGSKYYSVPSWNDDPERTVEEVLDAFERAAQAADAAELEESGAPQAAELEEATSEPQ